MMTEVNDSTEGIALQDASPLLLKTYLPTAPSRKRALFETISPSSELAQNLQILSTSSGKSWRSKELNQARRKLSLADVEGSLRSRSGFFDKEKKLSVDDGCFIESPALSSNTSPLSKCCSSFEQENVLFKRFASEPNCRFIKKARSSSVCLFPDKDSSPDGRSRCSDDKENVTMSPAASAGLSGGGSPGLLSCFKSPSLTPKVKKVAFQNQTNNKDGRPLFSGRIARCVSQTTTRSRRPAASRRDSVDDGFIEQFVAQDETPTKLDLPKNFERFLFSPLIECQEGESTPSRKSRESDQFQSSSLSCLNSPRTSPSRPLLPSTFEPTPVVGERVSAAVRTLANKRCGFASFRNRFAMRSESVEDGASGYRPMLSKRRKSDASEEKHFIFPALTKYHSEAELCIKSALNQDEAHPDLIGDFSRKYSLPLIRGKHQDLKTISTQTMASLLRSDFSDIVDHFTIVDCRYPYEYEGGHIKGAVNLYSTANLLDEFFAKPEHRLSVRLVADDDDEDSDANASGCSDEKERNIIIFHCEFSSERAPRLSRFLRNTDRKKNASAYPFLHYPELYLLEGGYKAFFEEQPDMCEPLAYVPMLHPNHSSDLRLFRRGSCSLPNSKSTSKFLFSDG